MPPHNNYLDTDNKERVAGGQARPGYRSPQEIRKVRDRGHATTAFRASWLSSLSWLLARFFSVLFILIVRAVDGIIVEKL